MMMMMTSLPLPCYLSAMRATPRKQWGSVKMYQGLKDSWLPMR